MVRRSLLLLGAALAVFHIWLFAGQVWSGALADPSLVIRWLVAGGLLGGLGFIRQRGESLVWGRKAVTIWALAALLHGPALATRLAMPGAAPVPETIVVLTQTVVSLTGLIGLGLFLAGIGGRRRPALIVSGRPAASTYNPPRSTDAGFSFAPRPPPHAR